MVESTSLLGWLGPTASRLVRYGITGTLSLLAHLGATVVLVELLGFRVLVATNLGFAASILVSYAMQRAWVFSSSRRHREALPRFLSVAVLSGTVNLAIMTFGHEALGLDYRLAQLIAIVVIPVVNYAANSTWTFGSPSAGLAAADAPTHRSHRPLDGASRAVAGPARTGLAPDRGLWLPVWSEWVLRRRTALLSVVAAWIVAPLIGLALRSDERYKIYLFGSRQTEDPLTLLRYPVETMHGFMALGNFRPLGRLWELAQYQLVYELSLLASAPAHVINGLWRVLCVVILVTISAWAIGRILRPFVVDARPCQVLGGLALAASLVAAGNRNPLVVFSGLYFITAAFTIATAAFFADPDRFRSTTVRENARLVGAATLGVAAASFNELTYLAVPVSGAALLVGLSARGTLAASRRSIPAAIRERATVAWLVFLASFAAVAVPTRLRIRQLCSMPDTACYLASSATVEGWSSRLLLNRLVSPSAPAAWSTTSPGFAPPSLGAAVSSVLIGAVVSAVAFLALRGHRSVDPRGERRGALGLAFIGAVLWVASALVASLSELLQRGVTFGDGWRDTPGSLAGLAFLLAATVLFASSLGRPRRRALFVLLVALVLGACSLRTADFNAQRSASERGSAPTVLNNRIALSLVNLDPRPVGNTRRCELQDEFVGAYGREAREWMLEAVDVIAEQHLGQPYCVDGLD